MEKVLCTANNPLIIKAIIDVARGLGISVHGDNIGGLYPYVCYQNGGVYRCNELYIYDVKMSTDEFIAFLQKNSMEKKTTFGKYDVVLTPDKLKVGCTEFTIKEVETFMGFLKENMK